MRERLLFVQFLHPGKEHKPDVPGIKKWNIGSHRRKFIKNRGTYLDHEGVPRSAELLFWSEWEPQSDVLHELVNTHKHYPRHIYKPYWAAPAGDSDEKFQNTDPFVFETPFKYALCQQRGKLKQLARGSVILFGSQIEKRCFCIDTVFVVSDWISYTNKTYKADLRGKVSDEYMIITLERAWDLSDPPERFRLYLGATLEKPVGGMFSFFPCKVFEEGSKGFKRPVIDIPDIVGGKPVINGRRGQGFACSEFSTLQRIKAYWERVVDQVEQQMLHLGVATNMPEKRSLTL